MTTDVTNIQNSTMMILRMCVRAPVMFVMALIMSISINARLASIFLVAIPIIGIMVVIVSKFAMPKFRIMLKKMDQLNRVVQENLSGIRVVKALSAENMKTESLKQQRVK